MSPKNPVARISSSDVVGEDLRTITALEPGEQQMGLASMFLALQSDRTLQGLSGIDLDSAIAKGILLVFLFTGNTRPELLAYEMLIKCFKRKWHALHLTRDLEQAIKYGEIVESIYHEDNIHLGMTLSTLSNSLLERYENISGDPKDLERAHGFAKQATELISTEYEDRCFAFSSLACAFWLRNEKIHAKSDLEQTIRYQKTAHAIISEENTHYGSFINQLGACYMRRYEQTGILDDLEMAIDLGKQALDFGMKKGYHRLPFWMVNLAGYYQLRYERVHDAKDIQQAIKLSKQAISEAAERGQPQWFMLIKLADHFYARYEYKPSISSDLDRAIDYYEWARELLPPTGLKRCTLLSNLAGLYRVRAERYNKTPYIVDIDTIASFSCFRMLLNEPKVFLQLRLQAAAEVFKVCAYSQQWHGAYEVVSSIVHSSPSLLTRSLTWKDQAEFVNQLNSLGQAAAYAALQMSKTPGEALEALEASRGLIQSILTDLGSEIHPLRKANEALYQEYTNARAQVLQSMSADILPNNALQRISHLEELEEKIREIPGFQGFLLPLAAAEMIALAVDEPIVCFNATSYGSHALCITSHGIESIALKDLVYTDLLKYVVLLSGKELITSDISAAASIGSFLERLLRWLWHTAVSPVIKHLGISKCSSQPPQRIWWISSGAMSTMPIHAAGDGRHWTSDFAISSYATSLKSLRYHRARNLPQLLQQDQRVVVVSMPDTPPLRPATAASSSSGERIKRFRNLNTPEEVRQIKSATVESQFRLLDRPTRSEVLEELREADIVHFACHGLVDSNDPSESSLIVGRMSDRTAERLSIDRLARSTYNRPKLAYLSACSTARNDLGLWISESIFMASAFQMVGFTHVIGTMWETKDRYAPLMAGWFYAALQENTREHTDKTSHWQIAYAYHQAFVKLRAMRPKSYITWAPYVHFGA